MTKTIKLLFVLMLSIVIAACSSGDEETANQSSQSDSGNNDASSTEIGEDIKVAFPAAPPHLDSHASPSQQTARYS